MTEAQAQEIIDHLAALVAASSVVSDWLVYVVFAVMFVGGLLTWCIIRDAMASRSPIG